MGSTLRSMELLQAGLKFCNLKSKVDLIRPQIDDHIGSGSLSDIQPSAASDCPLVKPDQILPSTSKAAIDQIVDSILSKYKDVEKRPVILLGVGIGAIIALYLGLEI